MKLRRVRTRNKRKSKLSKYKCLTYRGHICAANLLLVETQHPNVRTQRTRIHDTSDIILEVRNAQMFFQKIKQSVTLHLQVSCLK